MEDASATFGEEAVEFVKQYPIWEIQRVEDALRCEQVVLILRSLQPIAVASRDNDDEGKQKKDEGPAQHLAKDVAETQSDNRNAEEDDDPDRVRDEEEEQSDHPKRGFTVSQLSVDYFISFNEAFQSMQIHFCVRSLSSSSPSGGGRIVLEPSLLPSEAFAFLIDQQQRSKTSSATTTLDSEEDILASSPLSGQASVIVAPDYHELLQRTMLYVHACDISNVLQLVKGINVTRQSAAYVEEANSIRSSKAVTSIERVLRIVGPMIGLGYFCGTE